jgi:protein-tyrosine kinase
MSAHSNSVDHTLGELSDDITRAVIADCGLSADEIELIAEKMRTEGLTFVEAVIRAGILSQEDVKDAIATATNSTTAEHRVLDETGHEEPVEKPKRRDGRSIVEELVQREMARHLVVVPGDVFAKPSLQLIIAHAPDHPRSEQIRRLRTDLLLQSAQTPRASMIVLLSPAGGEGRSQLAAELAIAFSQLGRRTLLVDADLRRPRQHELFGTDSGHGLAQTLAGGGAPAMIRVDGLPYLSLVTAGSTVPNPSELLASKHAERLVGIWRHEFQFVVIDSPPVEAFSDGLIMAALAGRVLVVCRANISTHQSMKDMLRRLVSTQAHILGSVINQF